jgi:hypothetical protein
MPWKNFIRTFVITALAFGAVIFAMILVLDPYQNVPFSPALARAPVAGNQRFAYPALARDPQFDSVIVGTSTTRMLDPDKLDGLFASKFVNLSMNSATAYEESEILKLFLRNHDQPRQVIVGVDVSWCERREDLSRYTFRKFPQWMYDDNRWNDLAFLFNDKAVENAARMLELLLGRREPKYQANGYKRFVPDERDYDPAKARAKLYGREDYEPDADSVIAEVIPTLAQPSWRFAAHALLPELLQEIPAETQKILVFVPYHQHWLAKAAPLYAECKGRLLEISHFYPNTHLIDFMFPSKITADDNNYWDSLHYSETLARKVEIMIAEAVRVQADRPGYYRYLTSSHLDTARRLP